MIRHRMALALASAAVLVIAGCGSSGGSSNPTNSSAPSGNSGNSEEPASPSGSSDNTDNSKPIVVGLAVSLSGVNADTGQKLLDGVNFWISQGNKILDRPVELKVFDDESDPATSARLYERLITTEHADLLIGPYGSGPAAAVAQVGDRHNRFILQTGAAAGSIFTGSKTSVQMMSPQLQLPSLALQLAQKFDLKTIAAAAVDNPYGAEILTGVKQFADKYGMKVLTDETYSEDTADMSSMILKMKAANPDIAYVGAYVPDGVLFMKQSRQLDFSPKMYVLGATGPVTQQFIDSLGDTANYVMGTAQWFPGAPYPGAQEFTDAWQKAFPDKPLDYVQATGYGAMELMQDFTNETGNTNDDDLLAAAHAKTYHTMYGDFTLDKDGVQIADRGVITQIQDGKIVPVYPEGPNSKDPIVPAPAWSDR